MQKKLSMRAWDAQNCSGHCHLIPQMVAQKSKSRKAFERAEDRKIMGGGLKK